MLLWNLMTSSNEGGKDDWMTWVFLGVAVLMIGAMFFFSSRNQKKRQQEMQETLSALKPGCKVKTIGGICGVVVEVNREENTFVLETGNDTHGKSYMKFDMIAIYQTDAKKEAAPAEEVAEEAPVEETSTEDKE
jgi:preprotein translocase subunit YajC